jgi:hypothetical protein
MFNLPVIYEHLVLPVISGACIVCLVTLKIGKTIPKKSTGYQIYFLIIFILRTD